MKNEEMQNCPNNPAYSENKIEIDCVIFNFEDDSLKVMLAKQQDDLGNTIWGLANDWTKENETISGTARNILKKYIKIDDFFLEQLKAFGYRSPESQHEDIAIAYYALVKREKCITEEEEKKSNPDVMWIGINEISDLNAKHKVILDYSLQELRKNICNSAIGFNLLPEKFTLLQVIHLYQEILGIEVNKSNFRRKILQTGMIQGLSEKEEAVSHRAAKFYSLNIPKQEMFANRKFDFNF
ncbi:NUDIX hydrolase [Flavobacterium olei]|uniref:NUDIX hydrolase n=1 Tax=Flavobacterium olei TaxID=1886782 RepID=UPI00321A57B8